MLVLFDSGDGDGMLFRDSYASLFQKFKKQKEESDLAHAYALFWN